MDLSGASYISKEAFPEIPGTPDVGFFMENSGKAESLMFYKHKMKVLDKAEHKSEKITNINSDLLYKLHIVNNVIYEYLFFYVIGPQFRRVSLL